MKLNEEYFYCFGCGATGDVIDFTARLYNLSPKEAAEKLAQDFGLAYDSQAPPRRRHVRQKSEAQKFKEDRDHAFRVLADYFHLLRKWETDYTPKTPEENPHPRFMEAIQKKDYVGYLLDFFLENSPEEQKLWIAEHQSEIAKLERRVKFMADKTTNRERLQEITAGIEQGIKELFESEKYMRYLSVMSKFHRYSVNNTMLIYMQRPDATLVAGFNKWKNQFERHVKKGEHGITIIAPTPYKKKIEEMKRDPDTQAPILDADGKAVMEEKEIEIPMFRPVKVFDVSQTDGKPLPELASSLSGTVPHYEAFLEAVRRSAPVPIGFEPMAENMDGYFSSEQQRIALREGMSEVQTISAAVHETAHSKLHDPKKYEAEPTWKIVMVSEGGTKQDFRLDFATEAEAEQAASEDGWRYVDENQFEWRLGYHVEVQNNVKAALKARINSLRIGGKGLMMDTAESLPIGSLLDRPVVLELEDLADDDTKAFVIGVLLVQLYEYRKGQSLQRRTDGKAGAPASSKDFQHLLVVEEAHRLLKRVEPGEGNPSRAKSVEFFCNMLAEIRSYGQGLMICDQVPTKLAPDVLKNTNLKLIHRTVMEEDRRAVGAAMNMTDQQMEYLSSLRRGCAAVFAEGDNRPKLVMMPLVKDLGHRTREQILEQVRCNLRQDMAVTYETHTRHTLCRFCQNACDGQVDGQTQRMLEENPVDSFIRQAAEQAREKKVAAASVLNLGYLQRLLKTVEVHSGGKLDCRQQFCLAAKMIERLPLAQEEKYALAVKYQLWWSKVYQPQKEEKRRLQDG